MKKKTILLTAMLVIACPFALFAVKPAEPQPSVPILTDISLSTNANGIRIHDTDFSMGIEPSVALYFGTPHGLDMKFHWALDGYNIIGVGLGYTYKHHIFSLLAFSLKAGFDYKATFRDDADYHVFGIYMGADVYVYTPFRLFLAFGIRDTVYFGGVKKTPTGSISEFNLSNEFAIPRIAFGVTF